MEKIFNKFILYFLILIILLKYNIFVICKNFLVSNKKNVLKKIILSKIFKKSKKNINNISTLFIKGKGRFGNYFHSLNNAIIFCEFLGCKKLIMEFNNYAFINSTIFYKKCNITFEANQTFNSRDNNAIILNISFLLLFKGFINLRNKNRLYIFKKQLLKNLPKLLISPNDLYIYIRSGDIFQQIRKSMHSYFQPPLCFYEKILGKFKFRKVFIISQDESNPVIPKLLSKYSYIRKMKNSLKYDISYLINSYNLAAAKSTFFYSSIKLNDKLKYLWEYDLYSTLSKDYLNYHYYHYKFPIFYTIYKMNSSSNYRKVMHPWIYSPKQKKIMIEEKCVNNFDIIR